MTLIESLALAALHGFSRFVPISAEAHEGLLQRFLNFPAADSGWRTTFALGSLLALLVYFIHDWLSILSSFLQVLVYRKRPMTLDERFPFFLLFCMALPFGGLWYLTQHLEMDSLAGIRESLSSVALGALAGGGLLLLAAERWSRKNRGPFDLGFFDSAVMGLGQVISWVPGVGGTLGMLAATQARNYHLEAATKLTCLMSLPFVAFEALEGIRTIGWGTSEPLPGASWVQWSLGLFVATVAAFIALRVLNEQLRQNGFGRIVAYRIILAGVLAGLTFLH